MLLLNGQRVVARCPNRRGLHAGNYRSCRLPCVPLLLLVLLGFLVLLRIGHIALEIYVVPFSNAKIVGSFRMARLNMFRRTSAKNFSSPSDSKFFESLADHGMVNCTCVNSESIVKETNLKTICLTILKTVQL